jgi:hypothetical protein
LSPENSHYSLISFLNFLADSLGRKKLFRHVTFLGVAILAILMNGYHFGTFDQVIHIPFLKKLADPGLYPNDPFLSLVNEHYSYFWWMFLPALRAGMLEPVMFSVHLLSTYALCWMFWDFTDILFRNNLANLFSLVLLVFPHMGLSGFTLVEFSLLNRTFVLPFIIGAFILYLKRHYTLVFLILGVMFNFHIIYTGFAMLMVCLDLVLRRPEATLKIFLKGIFVFILFASPVLLWRAGSAPIDFQVRPDVLDLASSALLAGVYYFLLPNPQGVISTLHGITTMALFIIAWRLNLSTHDMVIKNFVLAIAGVVIIQIITTYWVPVTFILQLQILRIGVFLLIFGYIYFAGYIARRMQDGSLAGFPSYLVLTSFIIYYSSALPLLFLAFYNWMSKFRWRQWCSAVIFLSICISTLIAARISEIWSPGVYLSEPKTPWTQTQDWARNNTPRDAMFITPPEILRHYIPDWRTFSERGTLATLVEIYEFPHPDFYPGWKERFEAIAPGAISKFNGDYFDTFSLTKDAYYSLKPEEYLRIAQQYNVRYLVVEKPHIQPFQAVYENDSFVVYDLQ